MQGLRVSLLLLGLSFCVTHGDPNKRLLGSFPGVMDRMGAGIEEAGAGNTGTARRSAIPAAYWNPALLAFERKSKVAAGGELRSLNRNGGYAAWQGRPAPNMGLGLAVLNRGDMEVKRWDADENFLGTFAPQDFGFYLGTGFKTSRRNSIGVTLQWFLSQKDLEGGLGDINTIGIFNVGWYRSWRKDNSLNTAIVVRNLGMNRKLSANYSYTSSIGSRSTGGLDGSGDDYFPKTLVAAIHWAVPGMKRPLDLYVEFLDYQLDDEFFDMDVDHHAQGYRLGADWQLKEWLKVRGGIDSGNLTLGAGYRHSFNKKQAIQIDYALSSESFFLTYNIFSIGVKYNL